MTDAEPALEKPRWFTTGATLSVTYTSNRSDWDQSFAGEIVGDDGEVLTIKDDKEGVRELEVDSLDVYSVKQRRTYLGAVKRAVLWTPPWDTDMNGVATGYVVYARGAGRMVREGVWEFPDPDFMDRPEGWEP